MADKLSADIDPGVALEEVKISEPASLPADREKVTGPGKSDEGVLSFLAGTEKSGEQQPVPGLKSLLLTEQKEPSVISEQQPVPGLKSLLLTEQKEPFEKSLGIPGAGQTNIAES